MSSSLACMGNCFLASRNTGNSIYVFYLFLKISGGGGGGGGETPLGSSCLAAPKMLRPVLSEICLLLYITVQNPASIEQLQFLKRRERQVTRGLNHTVAMLRPQGLKTFVFRSQTFQLGVRNLLSMANMAAARIRPRREFSCL